MSKKICAGVFLSSVAVLVSACANKDLAADDGAVVIEVEDDTGTRSDLIASRGIEVAAPTTKITLSEADQAELAKAGNKPRIRDVALAGAKYCPKIEILGGTGILTAYVDGGDDQAGDITHQASITKSGRECTRVDGTMTIRVGAAGRAVKGPKSLSDSISLPIRVAVVRNKDEVLFSQLYTQQINFTSSTAQGFSFTENNISIPVPEEQNIQVLIGFDTKIDENGKKIASDAG